MDYNAQKPKDFSLKDWWRIFKRIIKQIKSDNIMIVAPGVAFFLFLAIFPAILALISLYGLIFNPEQVQNQLSLLTAILPPDAGKLIIDTLSKISGQPDSQLEWEVFISLFISLWSANIGSKALFRGINIVYEEESRRNFFQLNGISLIFTISGIVISIVSLALIIGFPTFIKHVDIPPFFNRLVGIGRWVLLGFIIAIFIAAAYKFAPERRDPKFRWVTWGAIVATLLWLAASWGFSYYVENFGNFDEKYGTVSSVVILMLWFYITSFLILLGAEINTEMEYQTKKDTTIGKTRPLGDRNAYHADHYAGQNKPNST